MSYGPQHTHDCPLCVHLGGFWSARMNGPVDVHFCPNDPEEAVILRHGPEGQDYRCFPLDTARAIASADADFARAVALYDGSLQEATAKR